MIVVFRLPEGRGNFHPLHSLMSRERLPGMEYLVQVMTIGGLENDMDVIGHDAPGQKRVALTIEVSQGILHQVRNFRTLHPTGTHAPIKVLLDLLGEQLLQPFLFHRGQWAALLSCSTGKLLLFDLPRLHHGLRQRIGQAEGDEVNAALSRPVGQISSLANTNGRRFRGMAVSAMLCCHGRDARGTWFVTGCHLRSPLVARSSRPCRPRGSWTRRSASQALFRWCQSTSATSSTASRSSSCCSSSSIASPLSSG